MVNLNEFQLQYLPLIASTSVSSTYIYVSTGPDQTNFESLAQGKTMPQKTPSI